MMSSVYLDALDDLLRPGIAGLSERFRESQIRFVAGCQQTDGGFAGRRGCSDPYYTDFALRTLAWLAPNHTGFGRAAGYMARFSRPPRDAVECFNILNARRLLERHSGDSPDLCVSKNGTVPFAGMAECLHRCLLPRGGFSRSAGDERASAYHTFLGSLCFQLLGIDMPAIDDAVRAVDALRRPDGGYVELAGQTAPQTSATAAAVAFLAMHDALSPEDASGTAQFLMQMQCADGGLKPHAAVQDGDLLSTFTGQMTLLSLGELDDLDVAGVARFLRSAAHPEGGFLACEGDDAPDVEYTHYGVGALALLRLLK